MRRRSMVLLSSRPADLGHVDRGDLTQSIDGANSGCDQSPDKHDNIKEKNSIRRLFVFFEHPYNPNVENRWDAKADKSHTGTANKCEDLYKRR
mmetsp:Transcript_5982/g.12324  ORF Transcript_5982/g.12324 Transcript_5982/m.12324 type:complete len:93 (+) Transcript_5982:64-342(+)|eukprot:scaffold3079_cov174-Amphora_coffeaeformis.AAC.24